MPTVVAENFGMDGVVDERRDGLALPVPGLDDAHPPVVEIGSIVVVGDLALGLAGRDLDRRRLEAVDGFIQG